MDNPQQAAMIASLLMPQKPKTPGLFNFAPYAGLRNSSALPAFETPGSSLPMAPYMAKSTTPVPGASVEGSPVIPQPMTSTPVQSSSAQHSTETRLPLGDQTRTAAFDPVADAADPGNVNMVNASGAVNPQMSPGAGALPDVQSAIAMLVKQGVLGPEWSR